MVHALQEIWRALAPRGILIDLRPLSDQWPIEILNGNQATLAGHLDDSQDTDADTDANNALLRVEGSGLFIREREGAFTFHWYWDTLDEMLDYVKERWTNTRLPEEAVAEAKRLLAGAGAGAKICIRGKIIISRWRKVETDLSNPPVHRFP